MTKREEWVARVREWKASGETSAAFAEGKPYTGSGLRYWASRLAREAAGGGTRVRVARVVRVGRPRRAAAPDPSVVVEVGAARITVRPGFDEATLAAVLAALVAGGRLA